MCCIYSALLVVTVIHLVLAQYQDLVWLVTTVKRGRLLTTHLDMNVPKAINAQQVCVDKYYVDLGGQLLYLELRVVYYLFMH